MDDLKYPIGRFSSREFHTPTEIQENIIRIQTLPDRLAEALKGMVPNQLDTPYREGGWTVRQVVHHLADSHMNAYIRTKWVLTEESPVIKAYFEKLWVETPECKADPTVSVNLLSALHTKWVILLKAIKKDQLKRDFVHPDTNKSIALHNLIGMYAWHGDHHLAHITHLKARMNW